MKFSILISSYNKGKFIEQCITNCLSQIDKELEIIVFDNYSNDETEKIFEKYSKKIIIKKKHKISQYPALNQIDMLKEAFQISSGEIICLLDADDYFSNLKIKSLKKLFLENKNVNIIFDKPKKLVKEKYVDFNFKNKLLKYIWPTIYPTSCISLKRDFFKLLLEQNHLSNYPLLEIDFRITVLSQMIDKKFIKLEDSYTTYRQVSDGIMSNIKKFSTVWWNKRMQAHLYLENIFNLKNLTYKRNIDYYLTKLIFNLLKLIKK